MRFRWVIILTIAALLTVYTTSYGSGKYSKELTFPEDYESNVEHLLTEIMEAESVETLLAINLADEYMARDAYTLIVEKFSEDGKSVPPFEGIRHAEQAHINLVFGLYDQLGLTAEVQGVYPDDSSFAEDDLYYTLGEYYDIDEFVSAEATDFIACCDAGVQGEVDNIALYEACYDKLELNDLGMTNKEILIFKEGIAELEADSWNHMNAFYKALQRALKD